jgi:hypothetical protein
MRSSFVVAAVLLAAACNIKKLTIKTSAELMREGNRAFDAEPDVELARDAAPGQIKTVEGLLVSAPNDRTLRALAARGCLEFAFGFLEDDLERALPEQHHAARLAAARATAMYDRAFLHAFRLLETFDGGLRAALVAGGPGFEARVARLPREALPGLAYGGMALASAINLNKGDPSRFVDLPKAKAMVARAHAIDPSFYHGGPAMTLGIIAVQAGDHAEAREYFREAIAASGGKYHLPKVMMARTLLVETGDRGEFEKVLESVLESPADVLPTARLANEIAKRRAARYLDERKRLF